MPEYQIVHRTTYRYPNDVRESHTVVHLQPRSDAEQYCTRYELSLVPVARVSSYSDRFGNDVQHFAVIPDHRVLSIVARSAVMVVRAPVPIVPVPFSAIASDARYSELYDERHPGAYVDFPEPLLALAHEIPFDPSDAAGWFIRAGEYLHDAFTYDQTATHVHSTITETVAQRAGVCQDYAHVLIALARLAGVPARYVSGYIFSGQDNAVLGAEASHAWAEAYLGPLGWVGYDPTNRKQADDTLVKVAVGRDYGDVSPVRGVYKGSSHAVMAVNVEMEMLAAQQ